MKLITLIAVALLLGAALCLSAPARAYTVYNHVGYQACIIDAGSPEFCALTVAPNGTYHSQQGDPRMVWFNWNLKPGVCYLSQKIVNIPETGSAKMYPDKVELYDSDGKLVDTAGMARQTCGQRQNR
ncbi:MAG: hypothetical protein KJ720_08665 [Proteobacteria bacterium]|nr:hypothetical protein [Pseudomonadota bacterium]